MASNIGLPSVIVEFKQKASTAIQRGNTGIVTLVLRDANEQGLHMIKGAYDIPTNLSEHHINVAPNKKPNDTTKYAGVFNMDSARSIAGCNSDQKLAAIITPDANPSITLSSFLLGDLNNTPVAAPNAVTNQVPSVAINAIITKLFISHLL